MRHFPRTARRRLAAASVAVVMAVGSTSAGAAADDLKDRQKAADKHVSSAKKELEHSSAALRKASARLSVARKQLSVAKAQLATARGKLQVAEERDAEMQAALDVAEAELAQAEAELAQGRLDRDAQREQVADTVAEMYAEGDPDLIAFSSLLDATSTEDLTRQQGVREVVVGQEARAYDELKAAEVLLEVREQQVADMRDSVAEKRQAAADQLVVRQQLEAEKETARTSVRELVTERSAARADARRARAKDLAKLRKAEKQQDRIQEMLRRRALRALRAQRAKQRANARTGSGDGYLSNPVNTYVTSPYGYRTHPIYHYWGLHDGVDFGGGCGVPLRAAAPGRVVASYWSDVYGRRLVVDHGPVAGVGLASIYNHASGYTVGVGAQVERGQVLGFQGSTGWSTACHLHYTVMANGRTVDPMNWL